MASCSIKWCGKNARSSNKKTDGLTFHRFPKDVPSKEAWISATKRTNWIPSKNSVVCSRHFSEDCFWSLKNGQRRLLQNSIPTKHLPATITDPSEKSVSDEIVIDQPPSSSSSVPVSTAPNTNTTENKSLITKSPSLSVSTTPKKKRKSSLIESPSKYYTPNKKRLCRRIIELSGKIAQKNKQLRNLKAQVKYCKKRIASLKTILNELEKKSLINSENADVLSKIGVANREIVKRQILRNKFGHVIRRKYSPELRSFALTLNFYSKKAYSYVRKTFSTCLPSLSTLTKWYQTIDGKPGFTTEALNALKNKAEASKTELLCALVFDEMKIKCKVEFEPSSKRTFGFVDFGAGLETDCNNECTEALVFLVVAINGSFKVPIGYFLIDKTTAGQKTNLVLQAIELCHQSKVTIKSVTFDGCPANLAMAKQLGCNLTPANLKTTFKHPVTGSNVFVFLDPVHMLKLVRNTFESYREFKDDKGNSVKWDFVEKLQQLQDKEGFHAANKLRAKHINFKSNIMKVKLASQLFSNSVATALEFCETNLRLSEFQGSGPTARMIRLLNDLFDILDSRVHGYGYKRALNQENYEANFEKLEECKTFLLLARSKVKVRNNIKDTKLVDSPRFTGFVGFCVAIESAMGMFRDLVPNENCPISYLPLHKISQDHIELFFSTIRSHGGSNDNPTARLFEAIYKKCLVHTELTETSSGNCVPLENIKILNCSSVTRINLTTPCHATETENLEDDKLENEAECIECVELSQFAENVIEYIAGFVANSLIKKIRCGTCIKALVSLNENKKSLISYRDKGGLIYPSQMVIKICRRSELVIKNAYINSICKTKDSINMLVVKVLRSFTGEQLFPDFQYHNYYSEDTNHLVDLTNSVINKYIDTRLTFLNKNRSSKKEPAIRRIYTKLIHFKNQ